MWPAMLEMTSPAPPGRDDGSELFEDDGDAVEVDGEDRLTAMPAPATARRCG